MLQKTPSLADQVYDAVVDEICDGRLAAGTHVVQEQLAARFGVSRQPVQQAMSRLKADGIVEEVGRRGLCVTRLDPKRMRDHYGIRAALDGWAARGAALAAGSDAGLPVSFLPNGRQILEAGRAAVTAGNIAEQVRHDDAFHFLIYAASGNPMVASTAEPHWRFLRRAMGDVLRKAQAPQEIWRQHGEIFDAIASGEADTAARLAIQHVEQAADRLAEVLETAAGAPGP